MNYQDPSSSNKRLKTANGAPLPLPVQQYGGAASLPAYHPPAPILGGRGGISSGPAAPPPPPSTTSSKPSASVDRSTTNGGTKPGLRLTVKAPPSKLRQATSSSAPIPPNPYADAAVSESDATPAPATRAARSTRNPRAVIEPESEEEEEDDAERAEEEGEEDEEDEEMEDADGEVDQELRGMEGSEEDEDDEDAEGEEDEEMEEEMAATHPPPPVIKQTTAKAGGKPHVTITAPPEGPLKSVEAKEMLDDLSDDDDDEELSELEEGDENELGNELGDDLGGAENEEDDLDSSDDDDLSRSATPDLSKLTRRQRGVYEEVADAGLMALSNEAQKKKHLTAEEHAMRRQEMARRRKNLSEKRNEEEKMDTINKLLKKPAPKRRTRAEIIAAQHAEALAGTPGAEDGEEERADPLFTRYISNAAGSRLAIPDEWLEGPVGEMFGGGERGGGMGRGGGRMVEEVA